MIDLVKRFGSLEKKITAYCIEAIERYDGSDTKKLLSARVQRLRESNDMMFGGPNGGKNTFKSKLAFPLVKERTIIREGVLAQNFRGDPLITLTKCGNTSEENAKNAQDLLTHNLMATKFRDKCFRYVKASCANYGTAVVYSSYKHSQKMGWQTTYNQMGYDRTYGVIDESQVAINTPVHVLNYIQNPAIVDSEASDYRGHRERINLSTLLGRIKLNPENYIKNNVENIVGLAKKQAVEDQNLHQDRKQDIGKFEIDIKHLYVQIHIENNEDDEAHYYVEIVADKIIRFQNNPNDKDLVPYSIYTFYPRFDSWAGNTDSEFVMPHENWLNMIMNMKADMALNALQQYIFYGKGVIDKSDWDNRFVNGGMIGVDLKDNMDLSKILFPYQFPDNSVQTVDTMLREVNSSAQKMNPRPDFYSRSSKTGPLQNTTAKAAGILEEQGDVIEAKLLEDFQYGLKCTAEHDVIILQQRLSEAFMISPEPKEVARIIKKYEILGTFGYKIETALTKNKTAEFIRMQNFLTGLMNFRGTQDPDWMNVNLGAFIKKFIQNADMGDIDELCPPKQPQGYQQSMNVPGQEQATGAAQNLAPEPVMR